MRTHVLVFCAAVLMAMSAPVVAQQRKPSRSDAQAATGIPNITVDPQIAAATKAVSTTQLRVTIEKLVSFGTRNTISRQDEQAIKAGQGIGAAREWIRSEFERYSKACGGCLEVKTDSSSEPAGGRYAKSTEVTNVYAVLRGTDPKRANNVLIVTGHYDSRGQDVMDPSATAPGANDDGSGVAVSFESARVLSKYKFPATIIFLAVAGEEQGLSGARHFAKFAKEQGWNVLGVLNDDTVGGDRSPGQKNLLRVFSEGIPQPDVDGNGDIAAVRRIRSTGGESDSSSRELSRYIIETAAAYLPGSFKPVMIFRPDRYLRGGDHTAFNQQGFAAVRLTEWRENYDHQHQNPHTQNGIEYGDLPKFVDYEYLANVARLNVATLAALASAPAPPENAGLDITDLTNNSTLKWNESLGAAAYEVLWRDTTAPQWQHAKAVKGTNHATIEESKDNVIFAVRAVDDKGHRSLPAIPRPVRGQSTN